MSAPNPNTIKSLIVTDANLSGMSLATRIFIGRLRIEVTNNPACLSDKIPSCLVLWAKTPLLPPIWP